LAVELPKAPGVPVLLWPFLRTAQSQEVAVVLEQFTQTGAGDAGQLDFGFFGCA
jgi:hypothetical protein